MANNSLIYAFYCQLCKWVYSSKECLNMVRQFVGRLHFFEPLNFQGLFYFPTSPNCSLILKMLVIARRYPERMATGRILLLKLPYPGKLFGPNFQPIGSTLTNTLTT